MHDNSMKMCRQFVDGLRTHCRKPIRVADVGSLDINGCYRELFSYENCEYVGFDIIAGKNVDVVLAGTNDFFVPPAYREAFDVVISGQCMEHVSAPWRWIKSVALLCRPGGLVWLMVPNTEVYHEHPIDCWRAWPDGMRSILIEGELVEVICRAEGPDTLTIARKPCRET